MISRLGKGNDADPNNGGEGKGVASDLQTVICKFQLDAMQRQSPHHRRCGREVPSNS
jgi:hypothetical protein